MPENAIRKTPENAIRQGGPPPYGPSRRGQFAVLFVGVTFPKTNMAMENPHVYAGMKLWDGPCSSQVFFLRACSLSVGNRHDFLVVLM